MTDPRADRLTDAAIERFLLARAPATAPADLADGIVRAASTLPQSRRPGWLPFGGGLARPRLVPMVAAGLALVALMLALLAVVGGSRPSVPVDGYVWSRAALGGPGSRAMLVDGARGWLFAAVWPKGVPSQDEVWRSDDGRTWQRIADQTPFERSSVHGFLDTGSEILAYGSRTGGPGRESLATWASSDGTSWRLVSDAGSVNPLTGTLGERLETMVTGGPGYVAVGTADGASFGGAATWTSPDGVSWTRSKAGIEGIETAGVVRLNSGFLTLTRIVGEGIYAWTSSDGVTWTRRARVYTDACCGPIALTNVPGGTPGGVLAVGTRRDGLVMRPFAWSSRDGLAWTSQSLPLPADTTCLVTESWPTCPVVASAVAADALHVVVAGSRSSGENGTLNVVAWSSIDGGTNWRVTGADPLFLVDAARGDRGDVGVTAAWAGGPNAFVLSGSTATTGAVTWFGQPFGATAPAP